MRGGCLCGGAGAVRGRSVWAAKESQREREGGKEREGERENKALLESTCALEAKWGKRASTEKKSVGFFFFFLNKILLKGLKTAEEIKCNGYLSGPLFARLPKAKQKRETETNNQKV